MSGGVGITPMMSMVSHFINQTKLGKMKDMKKVYFVWTVREQTFADNLFAEFLQPLLQNELENAGQKDDWRVKGQSEGPIFEFNFHMTGKSRKVKPNPNAPRKVQVRVDEDCGVELQSSTLTTQEIADGHQSIWKSDRPNLPNIFAAACELAQTTSGLTCTIKPRVTVSVCGPKPLVDAVRVQAVRSTCCGGGVTVDMHEELFNF
jgi:ferredoxin-NADP reductase